VVAWNAVCSEAADRSTVKRDYMATAKLSATLDQAESRSPVIATKTTEIIYERGKPVRVDGVSVADKRLVSTGRYLTTARLKDEWYDDVGDPEKIITGLKQCNSRPDIFTFWQRLPDISPIHPYYNEPEALSAIPLQTFQYWWEKQIKTDTRKKIKRPEKRGIKIKIVPLDDEFIRGVMVIFNETPVRRGRRFSHYGKSFEELKEMLSKDLAISEFIAAYYEGSLVGFVKLVYAEARFANPGLIVSKIAFRRKYVNNALVAKAVKLCTDRAIPYLTYTNWRRGSQADFLMRHGFEKISVPRYWIALTKKGELAIKLGFHHSLRARLPEPFLGLLLDMRKSFFDKWYKPTGLETESGLD
jgi:hypothetical protein